MRTFLSSALAMLLLASALSTPAAAVVTGPARIEKVLVTRVDGRISIDAAGQLTSFEIETPLPDGLRASLLSNAERWRFEPIVVDGQARPARARMRVVLAARPFGKDYEIRIDNVLFPDSGKAEATEPGAPVVAAKSLPPPHYPPNLEVAGVSGTVLLAIKVGADGKVEQAAPVQSALINVSGREKIMDRAIRELEASAMGAAKGWEFTVTPGDHPATAEELTVMVPVTYVTGRQKTAEVEAGIWRTEQRAPRREAPWLLGGNGIQQVGVSDLDNGEVVSIATKFSLKAGVIGAAL